MAEKTVEAAWQDGDALILSMPSSREGVYLVRVQPMQGGLKITHSCPATSRCWHQLMAAKMYMMWRWWDPVPEKLYLEKKTIILDPDWEQIPVPGTIPPELEAIVDVYASSGERQQYIA